MTKLTKDEAIALHDSDIWKDWSPQELALFQLEQPLMCVPFSNFHEATEVLLGRSVWTHEFAQPKVLLAEYRGEVAKPDMAAIVEKLRAITPVHRRLLTVDPTDPAAIDKLAADLKGN